MPKYRTRGPWLQTIKTGEPGARPLVVLHQDKAEVEYDGLPADNLIPIDAAAKRKRAEAEEVFAEQRQQAALRSAPGGSEILAALLQAFSQASQQQLSTREAAAKAHKGDPDPDKPETMYPVHKGGEGPHTKEPSPAKLGGPK